MHLGFLFLELFEDRGVQRGRAPDERHVNLLDFLLLLRLLLRLAIHLHRLLFLLDLDLDIGLLEAEYAVLVQARPDPNSGMVALLVRPDVLCGELGNPWVNATREGRRLSVRRLDLEGLLAIERERLSRRHAIALREDEQLSVIVGLIGLTLPMEFDRVRCDVVEGELAHTEDGRKHSAREGRTARSGLVLVQCRREHLTLEDRLNFRANSRDTRAATDELDRVDLLERQSGVGECLLDRARDALEDASDEFLVLLTGEARRSVDVVHDRLDVERGLSVCRQHLLDLVAAGGKTEGSLRARKHVDLVLLLELHREMPDKGIVDVTTTCMTVVRGCLHVEPTLGEGNYGGGGGGVPNIDEDNVAWVLRLGEV